MPVLESTDHVPPRSALRHRPIGGDATKREPIVSTGASPVVQRASRLRPKQTDGEEEIKEWQRADSGTTRQGHTTTAPRQAGKAAKNLPREMPAGNKGKFWRGAHPLLYLGIGMLAMLVLWIVLSLAVSWGNTTWNDLQYGRPRTFQIDAFVEQNEAGGTPSHFIAINLNGRIEVIEFPGGDGSKARIYLGPQLYGTDANIVPVTLSFVDASGTHQPDMIVHIHSIGWLGFSNSEQELVYMNENGGFRPANPDEFHAVERYLQQHGH